MIDFTLLENEDFKEDSVREVIITPLLSALSFKERNSKSPFEIARSPKLTSPTILGSNTKTTLSSYPDYVLYLHNKPHCVLDAKAPSVDINSSSKAEAQAFYYAINAEVKAPFYALCNGKSLTLFETNGRSLLAEFLCEELFSNDFDNTHFALLKQYLTTSIESLRQALSGDSKKPKKSDEWYLNRELPKPILNPKTLAKEHLGDDVIALVLNHAEALIAKDNGASLEEIHNEITIKGLELGFLHQLGKDYADLTPLINIHFDLDEESGKYHIKKGQKFKSHAIPLELRTRYFLLSYLRGAKRQGKKAYFDDICLEIIPLLKNGVSPSKDFIREILSEIATPNKETGEWKLKGKKGIQGSFDL